MLLTFLTILLMSVTTLPTVAQTVILSPTGDGGLETGTTLAANGWTEAQAGSMITQMTHDGGSVQLQKFQVRGGLYISNNGGTSFEYKVGSFFGNTNSKLNMYIATWYSQPVKQT